MIGQLLLRTLAGPIASTWPCSPGGSHGTIHLERPLHIHGPDLPFLAGWTILFVLMRGYNISYLLENQ